MRFRTVPFEMKLKGLAIALVILVRVAHSIPSPGQRSHGQALLRGGNVKNLSLRPIHEFTHNTSVIKLPNWSGDSKVGHGIIRLMHITDSHLCVEDEHPPFSSRMCNAFKETKNEDTGLSTTPAIEFRTAVRFACNAKADAILLGGDLLSFPSEKNLNWVLDALAEDCPTGRFLFVNGNHDWLLEGRAAQEAAGRNYYWQRDIYSQKLLAPLFRLNKGEKVLNCRSGAEDDHINFLQGSVILGDSVRLLWLDNSNFQISPEQLAFFESELRQTPLLPVVLLVHIPFYAGMREDPRGPTDSCGHPQWGAIDPNQQCEDRPRWALSNEPSTEAFLGALERHAAPNGLLVAVLAGHSHRSLVCQRAAHSNDSNCSEAGMAIGTALEYTTGANAMGASRLIQIEY